MMRVLVLFSLLALAGCGEGVVSVARAQQAISCDFYCAKKLTQATIDGVVYPACLHPGPPGRPFESATFNDGRMTCPTDEERGGKCDACEKQQQAQKVYDEKLLRAAQAAAAALPQAGLYVNPVARVAVIYDEAGNLWTFAVAPDLVSNPLTLLPTLTKVVLESP